jgi:high-affinity iron transporter
VLTGKGIAALQEAGWLGVSRVGGVPQIDVLGLHPTVQAIGAQVLVIAALIIGFRFGARAKPAPNA